MPTISTLTIFRDDALSSRIAALPNVAFTAYTNVCIPSVGSSCYGRFQINIDDLNRLYHLAAVAQSAEASEICNDWISDWSDTDLSSDSDRIVLTPTLSHQDHAKIGMQLRSFLSNTEDVLVSDYWQLGDLIHTMELAVQRDDYRLFIGTEHESNNTRDAQAELVACAQESFLMPADVQKPTA